MSKNQNIQPSKIDELESIRGIAALVVVMSHVPAWSLILHSFSVFKNAYLMVDLFFVLSGFVICKAYGSRVNSFMELAKFQFLRFGRLYPVHLTFLLVYLGIECLKYVLQVKFNMPSLNKPPFSENNGFAFLKELLLIQAFWPNQQAIVFNGPAWSISAEFYTYLIFAFITLFAKTLKFYFFGLLFLVGFILLLVLDFNGYDFMMRCITGFFLGCLVARMHERYSLPVLNYKYLGYLLLGGIFVFAYFTDSKNPWNVMMFLLTALLIISILKTNEAGKQTILSNAFFVWLGKLSFSLYMSHSAVLWFYSQAVRFVFKRPEIKVENLLTPQFSNIEGVFLAIGFLATALCCAYLTFILIENPFRKKSRQLIGLSK